MVPVPIATRVSKQGQDDRRGRAGNAGAAVAILPGSSLAIVRSRLGAKHAGAEVCGVIAPRVTLAGTDEGRGILQLINRAPMSFSARHELILLIERLELIGDEDIDLFKQFLSANGSGEVRANDEGEGCNPHTCCGRRYE